MEIKEIREKTDEILRNSLINFKKELLNLRFQKVYGQLANTSRVKEVRRSIAKINTVLNERKKIGGQDA